MNERSMERRSVPRTKGIDSLHISSADSSSNNDFVIKKRTNSHPNAMLIDISRNGIGFVTKQPLEPGSTIFIQLSASEQWVWLKARVLWRGATSNRYGSKLLLSREEQELLAPLIKQTAQAFIHDRSIYLPDTNAEGNAYFARHFDWQGETREAYLKQSITPQEYEAMVKSRTRLITVNASLEFYKPVWLFDEVRVRMTTRNIRHASLEMWFSFFNKLTGEIIAQGHQRLAFQNKRGRLIGIPPFIKRIAHLIQENTAAAETARQA